MDGLTSGGLKTGGGLKVGFYGTSHSYAVVVTSSQFPVIWRRTHARVPSKYGAKDKSYTG